ncbi:MAG: monovalent cation/H+ antiporter subunit D family protein [Myxococcota bacterium]|nr:monovalent cation/H+ antiporter subunit D family protein [Myxococcota bacterium]
MNMLMEHLPVLQIAIPLVAAPLVVFVRHRLFAWICTVLTSFFCLYGAITMLDVVQTAGPLVYQIGGWEKHVGIVYRVDVANAFILTIVSAISAAVFLFAKTSVEHEIPERKQHYFYAALLLCFTGLMGIAITGDAFNVFVFLEISSLSGYALIAMGRDPRCLTAAFRYLIMGTLGGTFIMLGIGFLYMMTGTLNMEELSQMIPAVAETSVIRAAFALITVGVCIKLALFPLHMWLANCYTYAPSVVSAFLSATATKVSFYVVLRTVFTLFGVALLTQEELFFFFVLFLAVGGVFFGSVIAIAQSDVKRLLAYSSVAQIGYMAIGMSLGNVNGLTGGLIHLFNHALTKGGLFLVMGCIFYRIGSTSLKDMEGLGKKMPLTMLAFALGGLSLIGVPLTAGFVSKWYLVLGAFDEGMWWLLILILVASLLAVIYVFKVLETAYFKEPPPNSEASEAPLSLLLPTYILIGATIYFGIWTEPMLEAANNAATMFLPGGAQ